jgi:hypothetical protein
MRSGTAALGPFVVVRYQRIERIEVEHHSLIVARKATTAAPMPCVRDSAAIVGASAAPIDAPPAPLTLSAAERPPGGERLPPGFPRGFRT